MSAFILTVQLAHAGGANLLRATVRLLGRSRDGAYGYSRGRVRHCRQLMALGWAAVCAEFHSPL